MIWLILLLSILHGAVSQLHYSVPEEQEPGSVVGNIAEDLGLDITKLSARRFQTVPSSRTPYLEVNLENGALVVKEKIDREEICKKTTPCLLHLEVFLENPLELFRVEIEVMDINDNPPSFPETDISVEISESAIPGTRFPVENAFDPDVGTNALSTYAITNNNYFYLDVQTQSDGNKFAELVLEKSLDREQQAVHRYVLTAVDGGIPQRTGTALLVVKVLDSNDNAPTFDQSVYSVNLRENSPVGTLIIQLNATDVDEGQNGEIVYSFSSHNAPRIKDLFNIDARTGRIEVAGEVDYEESSTHQIYVQAKDMGANAVPAHCKVLVKLVDVNDNTPEIGFSTVTESVSEQDAPGTVIALFSVSDRDSGENGHMSCEVLGDVPFKLKSSFKNYYTIVTDGPLDRENTDSYTITVVAKDKGQPSLATSKSIKVHVSDENDNAPRFTQAIYDVYVTENNVPGAFIHAVSAMDPDIGQNALITYSILECEIQGMSVDTYVSINQDTGYLYALRSFDYELLKEFSFMVHAKDGGAAELFSNATVNVIIVDQNDNAPTVIAPIGKNGTAKEHLPRSAEPGYLAKETSLDLTLILIIALGSVSFIFLLAMIVLAVRCQKDKKLDLYTCLLAGECCMCCGSCCSRQARGRKQKKLSKSDIMLVQSTNVTSGVGPVGQVPVEESGVGGVGGGFGSHHQNQNSYCYQVCLTPESAKTDLMFLKPCSPSRSTDTDHTNPCGAIVTGYSDQQPDIISNGSILSNETKHQRAELSYLVDRPRRVNSSAFQEADIVSSKDSGHGDSEQGDSDHDATNRGHSAGADLFSNCTEECKALGHSDRCWMPSFVPSDGRQGPDYRSNLHVPGMDATLPDTEVPSSVNLPDQLTMTSSTASSNDRSFSTFGKDGQRSQSHQSLHHHLHQQQPQYSSSTLERKEYDRGTLPYKPTFLCEYQYENSLGPYDFGLVQNRY
ncbi:hypothetical protein F7725_005349 [Dissostichus mawsoni]|uniref:Cadherin domain-containing protein n=1 Tax=Dissostichus mawsoni TaxID=36200 RepID=A0A7J5YQZ2_DISMA|nr:hypothetical protein F7725_005349 [Dissostichus mawsoni]